MKVFVIFAIALVGAASALRETPACALCVTLSSFTNSTSPGQCESQCQALPHSLFSAYFEEPVDCGFICAQLGYVREKVENNPRDSCVATGYCDPVGFSYEAPLVARASEHKPVVLMHGITSAAPSMAELAGWISAAFPGIYVKNVEIGNGWSSSFLMPLNTQISNFCKQMKGDPNLKDGFDLIGFSQGTAITRGYIQKCNDPPVRNYISLAGVHGGIFGLGIIPKIVDRAFHSIPYDFFVQRMFTFAQLWRDPFNLDEYLAKNIFFPDFNNEKKFNVNYKIALSSLRHMVLMYSAKDDVIRPQLAGWFEGYAAGTDNKVIPLRETDGYKKDLLGLKTLDESGRLITYESDCLHTEHVGEECKEFVTANIFQYLGNNGN